MKPSAPGALVGDLGAVRLGAGRREQQRCAAEDGHDEQRKHPHAVLRVHGVFNSHRCRSLSAVNLSSVGMLLPAADRASASFEFGTDFGITR